MANKKENNTSDKKKSFIEELSKMSEEDIQDYIKKNGKTNNKNCQLFVPLWECFDPRNKNN